MGGVVPRLKDWPIRPPRHDRQTGISGRQTPRGVEVETQKEATEYPHDPAVRRNQDCFAGMACLYGLKSRPDPIQ